MECSESECKKSPMTFNEAVYLFIAVDKHSGLKLEN